MDKVFVANLKAPDNIHSIFLVKTKNVSVDKKGNSYLSLTLSDKTGQVDARFWGNVEELTVDIDDFVMVKGVVQKFQNRNQIVVHSLEVVDGTHITIADYLPVSKFDKDVMFDNLLKILRTIENPFIKKLMFSILEDPQIQPLFKTSPAAKSVHHAYIGGLLEHALSICEIMSFLASHYKNLNRDLLLFGAVFHDIGKIWELSFETQIGYTDVGRLVGHIPLGSELVEKRASEISNFPVELKNICKHIVLSHHGLLEYGSPKRPKCLEAIVVGMIDDLDSKMNSVATFMASHGDSESKWTSYNQMFDRYFYTRTLKNESNN